MKYASTIHPVLMLSEQNCLVYICYNTTL